MEERRLLACYAHPDDESFGWGGVLALASAAGGESHLVVTTSGEEGEIADPELATHDNLGEVRRRELREAAALLRVDSLEMLGYRDSGMAGTASNRHPDAYIQADGDEVVGRLVAVIRKRRPNVVVTFDAHGAYGHPDHIAVHHHTTAAVRAAGDAGRYPEAGEPWQPDRLFYTAIPRRVLEEMIELLRETGVDPSELQRPDMPILGQPDEEIHVVVDASEVMELKRAAVHAHRTQLTSHNPLVMFPRSFVDRWMGTEYFTLGWGKPMPEGDGPAGDLFAGL